MKLSEPSVMPVLLVRTFSLLLAVVLLILVSASLQQRANAAQSVPAESDDRPANCRMTLPADGRFVPPLPFPHEPSDGTGVFSFWFGTEKLWTQLPTDGTWRSWESIKPGDFVYGDKLPWFGIHSAFSREDGQLTVTGKRLDGPAPSFTATFESNTFGRDDDYARIMSGINIPTFGCWEITGRYRDQELTFTVWVTRGPEEESTSGVDLTPAHAQPRRIDVDAATQAKSLVYKIIPVIPPTAKAARISGTVVLHAIITTAGRARELQYVSGPPLLAQAAIDAVKWWQYRVAVDDENIGTRPFPVVLEPLEVDTTIEVVFPASQN
jgi:hypothetical protein